MEDAIRQPDLAKSVQRYQLAVDEAKVRLNLAVCPGAWLMPASMIINTKSTVGYNNRLKQAVPGMKLGVNNDVNSGTKKVGIQNMEGGPAKVNPPNSHPSNPIHKAAMAAQKPASKTAMAAQKPSSKTADEETVSEPQHEINKTAVIRGIDIACITLTALFDVFFKNENNRRQNQEPGMLGEKSNRLPRSFEKEADDRAN